MWWERAGARGTTAGPDRSSATGSAQPSGRADADTALSPAATRNEKCPRASTSRASASSAHQRHVHLHTHPAQHGPLPSRATLTRPTPPVCT